MSEWTAERVPRLSGRKVVITGANSGIGFEAAKVLALKGAHVVLACRSQEKANDALERIRESEPNASLETVSLDLADLASVRSCAATLNERFPALDLLINNAGVMALPRRDTKDGFEMQFGTNHLGHFAFTGLLMPSLLRAPVSRVVTVASQVHRGGKIDFDNLQGEKRYGKWAAYCRSKLANLLFVYELDRRLKAAGKNTISVACHPGYAATNLQFAGPKMSESSVMEKISEWGNSLFAQDAFSGALPTLFASVEPLQGGEYVGPSGWMEMQGSPKIVQSSKRSHDVETARRLWEVSEELTGVRSFVA